NKDFNTVRGEPVEPYEHNILFFGAPMLYGLLLTLFVIVAFLLIIIIMIQQSKGSMGFGSFGGQAQMLFGGSGGQDMFQKITWVLGAMFMAGALMLSLMKSSERKNFRYISSEYSTQLPINQNPE